MNAHLLGIVNLADGDDVVLRAGLSSTVTGEAHFTFTHLELLRIDGLRLDLQVPTLASVRHLEVVAEVVAPLVATEKSRPIG
jgi:hypothetical protein